MEEITPSDAAKLADAIRRIDKAFKELDNAGLNRKAIVVLLNESTGVARRDINAILDGLNTLGATYLDRAKEQG
jgi:hypothetical protein